MTAEELAKMIDHTVLKTEATAEDVRKLCEEAKEYGFACVCVNPAYVSTAIGELEGGDVKVCSVSGFPLGASTTATKAFEAEDAIDKGASEIDMVLNVGVLRSGNLKYVFEEVQQVVQAVRQKELTTGSGRIIVKVIIEACYLSRKEKMAACGIVEKAGADFIKTSTGFGAGGATVADVRLLRDNTPIEIGVKASGGIRTFKQAQAMLDAGATRVGTSAGVAIMEEFVSED